MKRIARLLLVAAAVLVTGVGFTDNASAQAAPDAPPAGWTPLPPESLDAIRGGFVMPSGLVMAFGIERAVYVNGELAATSRLHISNANGITATDAASLAGLNDTLLVQVGEGNHYTPSGLGGVVVQNTLDNQHIRTLTTIEAAVGTLGVYQQANSQATLQSMLYGALGGP